ncbi:MAG: PIN domain-containing protein [Fibromonadales bacterium]|nr:PIN domain-containing protein [Fibromonadales bacterium]
MVALIDTDVLIDALVRREPFDKEAKEILEKCYDKTITGFVAAHSFTNMFYILRKVYSIDEMKQLLLNLSKIVNIVKIDELLIVNSLKNSLFSDVEDCLQAECAKVVNADYIVTRNIADFKNSFVSAISPSDFLNRVNSANG